MENWRSPHPNYGQQEPELPQTPPPSYSTSEAINNLNNGTYHDDPSIYINIEPVRYLYQPANQSSSNYWSNQSHYASNMNAPHYQHDQFNNYRQGLEYSNFRDNHAHLPDFQNQYSQARQNEINLNEWYSQNSVQGQSYQIPLTHSNISPSSDHIPGIPPVSHNLAHDIELLSLSPQSDQSRHVLSPTVSPAALGLQVHVVQHQPYDQLYEASVNRPSSFTTAPLPTYSDANIQTDLQSNEDVESNASEISSISDITNHYNLSTYSPTYEDSSYSETSVSPVPIPREISPLIYSSLKSPACVTYDILELINITLPKQSIVDRYTLYNRSIADYLQNHSIVVLTAYKKEIKKKSLKLNLDQSIE